MNFLAHIYLSMDDPELMISNFIADSVRKVQYPKYSPKHQVGFELHHFIDHFTDHHPLVKSSQERLHNKHGKYAAVLTDLFFDHYLARDWQTWHPKELDEFTQEFYGLLNATNIILPKKIKHLRPYMIRGNWLYNYQYLDGMTRVLNGMSRRASFANKIHSAIKDLEEDYLYYESIFNAFFPELIAGANRFLLSQNQAGHE